MTSAPQRRLPQLSNAGLKATANVTACNEYNELVEGAIAVERALTIYLDKREIVTLMTLGNHPELLILGWLRNQRMIEDIEAIKAIQVDWEAEAVAITTHDGVENLDKKLSRKTVTTGCGQGTVFGDLMEDIDEISLQQPALKQSSIYALLNKLNEYRHNAVDAIAGYMWLNDLRGHDKLFYTTGRLTSEMVIKVALMEIPVLLSRSGITAMGLEIAQKVGVTLIARAKGRHFLVYHGGELIEFDQVPPVKPQRTSKDSRRSPD
jgi:FdhD protein